jgi:hypothetical protein
MGSSLSVFQRVRRNNTHHLSSVCWSSFGASSMATTVAAAEGFAVLSLSHEPFQLSWSFLPPESRPRPLPFGQLLLILSKPLKFSVARSASFRSFHYPCWLLLHPTGSGMRANLAARPGEAVVEEQSDERAARVGVGSAGARRRGIIFQPVLDFSTSTLWQAVARPDSHCVPKRGK